MQNVNVNTCLSSPRLVTVKKLADKTHMWKELSSFRVRVGDARIECEPADEDPGGMISSVSRMWYDFPPQGERACVKRERADETNDIPN